MFALPVFGARLFVDSWTRALVYGVPCFGALQLLGFWSRRRETRAEERQHGRIRVRGPVLTIETPARDEASSIPAAAMRQLWYEYSAYGWSGANSWGLVYEIGNERKQRSVYEVSDHLIEPLRAWCVRHLEGFDAAAFDRLAMSMGDDEAEDVLVWSRRNG